MDLETARNEIKHPSKVTALEILSGISVFVIVAVVTVQLFY